MIAAKNLCTLMEKSRATPRRENDMHRACAVDARRRPATLVGGVQTESTAVMRGCRRRLAAELLGPLLLVSALAGCETAKAQSRWQTSTTAKTFRDHDADAGAQNKWRPRRAGAPSAWRASTVSASTASRRRWSRSARRRGDRASVFRAARGRRALRSSFARRRTAARLHQSRAVGGGLRQRRQTAVHGHRVVSGLPRHAAHDVSLRQRVREEQVQHEQDCTCSASCSGTTPSGGATTSTSTIRA